MSSFRLGARQRYFSLLARIAFSVCPACWRTSLETSGKSRSYGWIEWMSSGWPIRYRARSASQTCSVRRIDHCDFGALGQACSSLCYRTDAAWNWRANFHDL